MTDLFFSKRLTEKTDAMRSVSLTIVEAPAGYGKTTAVRHALEPSGAETVSWYTAVETVPGGSFGWFIQQIEPSDPKSARRLQALGLLNRSNAGEAAAIVDRMTIETPLYLVIDNFQYILQDWQPQLLRALSARSDGLHVILIAQNFGRLHSVLSDLGQNLCRISLPDLSLTEAEIGAFAQQLGLSVSPEQIHRTFVQTEGWTIAVSLCLKVLLRTPGGLRATDIDGLLYEHFYLRMSPLQQELLLRLCPYDCLYRDLIEAVLPKELGVDYTQIFDLLAHVPLLGQHNISERRYFPHEIPLRFLRRQLSAAPQALRRDCLLRAGLFFRDFGRPRDAVHCLYKAQAYAEILTCPLKGLLNETFDEVSYTEIARTVLRDCSEEEKSRHPVSVLLLCYALYAGGAFQDFQEALRKAQERIEASGDRQMLGEWFLVSALSDFPDVEKMGAAYRRAEALLSGPSQVFTREEPFLFGSTSMWYLFYTTPGEMMRTADRLAETMAVYNRLTNGHGAGAAELYRGEALSVQGRFEESEIEAYQAAFLSEQAQNASVTYGTALLLGINAIYQSDMSALQNAIDYLENKARAHPFLQGTRINQIMVETVRGYLLSLLMEPSRSAVWTQGEADTLTDLSFTNFMVKTCRITDLILKKNYRRAIASVEVSLKMDPRLISLPTRNFMYVGLVLCYLAIGRLSKAADYLDRSLSIAVQDKNYTFLACFRKYLSVLFLLPTIAARHADAIREIRALDIHYTKADESRIFASLSAHPETDNTLTEREREIAGLAAKGMRNSEIARLLSVSENTVKTHLKSVFQKLNIDRRSRLIELLK